ncbi:diguanylate cyclase and metal dependent phosphohydrolase [Deinococcus maricopensis DSM 21211]|uniref:Diguanylate cyclase and metal dependent phosphohydrolase n=1 Tax=Deinococcus maricopensis (strain DSM 21211 / LMG 22137 / NRRL B-23946 / LB-34) TaxID=709986 RepID=E8U3R2_DEIML|nr:diguanylate cyclase and metal dependent phosphohydrolase [Deinococcus maricopensis DSM 21211]
MQARSALLLGQAHLAGASLAEALTALEQAVTLASPDQPALQAEAEAEMGKARLLMGDLEQARADLERARGRLPVTGDADTLRAFVLNQLAGVLYTQGAMTEALHTLEQALPLWERLGDLRGLANGLTNVGNINIDLGEYHAAAEGLARAYRIYQVDLQDLNGEAKVLLSLADMHQRQGNVDEAIRINQDALTATEHGGNLLLRATTTLNLGSNLLTAGRHAEAAPHLAEALRLSRHIGYREGELFTLDSLGTLHEQEGDVDAARTAHEAALSLALEIGHAAGELNATRQLGRLDLLAGQVDTARAHLERSLHLAEEMQAPREQAEAHQLLAEVLERTGALAEAITHLRASHRIERELFNEERDRQTRELTVRFDVQRARHEADVYRLRTEAEQQARATAEALVQERTADLERAQYEIVTRLAMAAEYRDDTTGEHTWRVGRAAASIARALGWAPERAELLGIAARLHDVGKIGIPDAVLLKRDRLTKAEFAQMQLHPLIGAQILSGSQSPLLQLAEEVALSHHERWDGGGYPRGLAGDEIPLSGRIVAVADVFDALMQVRPYKRAWSVDEALAELQAQSGQHFDPAVVAVASEALRTLSAEEEAFRASGGARRPDMPGRAWPAPPELEALLQERRLVVDVARREAAVAAARGAEGQADALTGLGDRAAFELDAHRLLMVEGQGVLVSLALEGLKDVNHQLGQVRGDLLLRTFAEAAEAEFGPRGRVYRVGGDAFAVLLPGTLPEGAAQARVAALAARVCVGDFARAQVKVGVVPFPEDAASPEALLHLGRARREDTARAAE